MCLMPVLLWYNLGSHFAYLFTYGSVVIGVQYCDVDLGSGDVGTISGRHGQLVPRLALTVQGPAQTVKYITTVRGVQKQ